MPSTPKLILVGVPTFVLGTIMLISWISRLAVAGSPVVTGNVVARTPISEWGVPRADFTIRIPGLPAVVHGHTQRYLLNEIPDEVRFHYSGDPSRQVYLFEHEENPLWIWLLCWALSAVFGAVVYYRWSSARAGRTADLVRLEDSTHPTG